LAAAAPAAALAAALLSRFKPEALAVIYGSTRKRN
jgi:hypothetical protein